MTLSACQSLAHRSIHGGIKLALEVNWKASLGDVQLGLTGHEEASVTRLDSPKLLLGQSDVCLLNPDYAYLRAAGVRGVVSDCSRKYSAKNF